VALTQSKGEEEGAEDDQEGLESYQESQVEEG
jgi:hypothetical protein